MHAAEGDDIGVGFLGLVGQAERVAHVVGDFLDLGDLVIVGQDDGVALLLEAQDFGAQVEGGGMAGHGGHGYAFSGGAQPAGWIVTGKEEFFR